LSLENHVNRFSESSKPSSKPKGSGRRSLIYVIQEHHARKLHYDLRLEMGGVLRSWAIPKEPPREPGIRRLAIQTEDHPLEYANFEGCLEYNTTVLTREGPMRIGDIVENRLSLDVLSYNVMRRRLEWRPVIGWFRNGVTDDFLELLVLSNSSFVRLILTPNHVIYTPFGKRRVSKLRKGDYVIVLHPLNVKEVSLGIVGSLKRVRTGGLQRYDIRVKQNSNYFAELVLVSNSIPEGMYGAGTVKIWDKGTYEPIEITDDKLVFEINGTKLKGRYALIRMKWRGKENYWLFFKVREV